MKLQLEDYKRQAIDLSQQNESLQQELRSTAASLVDKEGLIESQA